MLGRRQRTVYEAGCAAQEIQDVQRNAREREGENEQQVVPGPAGSDHLPTSWGAKRMTSVGSAGAGQRHVVPVREGAHSGASRLTTLYQVSDESAGASTLGVSPLDPVSLMLAIGTLLGISICRAR